MHNIRGLRWLLPRKRFASLRALTQSCTGANTQEELTIDLKHQIEQHWQQHMPQHEFDAKNCADKFYVLSMFPYPSGNLHMGHVRVYTISDAMARFHRMCGLNVFQPIGWDAFGLPAENAALQRGIEPADWTEQNIQQMKQQLQDLRCSFDWKHEFSTCSPSYYKWTQQLFLMLHREGLAYRNEALVNWDPVDKTVLADEQVDENGCSWRSGAKVEKKPLKQWFIRTTAFAKQLLEGLEDPCLQDWRDIINLQRHWLGECDGYVFQLLTSASNLLRVWTKNPEYLKDNSAFLVLKTSHFLHKLESEQRLSVENPFCRTTLPIVFSDDAPFADKCDVYLASPAYSEQDKHLQTTLGVHKNAFLSAVEVDLKRARNEVLEAAQRLKIGGYRVSSKLQDWLISRQRHWGTPIPIVHCNRCGAMPVPQQELPVLLPNKTALIENREETLRTKCPSCGNPDAQRESDTMDTFVDSSWYYLRFLDANNEQQMFDERLIKECMPVDLYIGGKEHAVLHLYYARFMNHFLHSLGKVPTAEPFSRLLVQGMVMGRSYRLKGSGRYVTEAEVQVTNAKKNQAVLKETNQPVVMLWEKMSKSKLNGVDPSDMFKDYGTDTTRLIILADVAPTSHRNWSSATFPGILNWQKRLWLTVNEFCDLRAAPETLIDLNDAKFVEAERRLCDSRNYYIKGATFNYRHTHQLSVAISKMQGLTNSLRRAPKENIRYGKEFERALATQLIMLAPMAPHFASELWSKFAAAPNRLNDTLAWNDDVLQQRWPDIDNHYQLDLSIRVNNYENCVVKIARNHLDNITHNDAMDIAFNTASVTTYLTDKRIRTTNFVLYPGIEAVLYIYVDQMKQKETSAKKSDKKLAH